MLVVGNTSPLCSLAIIGRLEFRLRRYSPHARRQDWIPKLRDEIVRLRQDAGFFVDAEIEKFILSQAGEYHSPPSVRPPLERASAPLCANSPDLQAKARKHEFSQKPLTLLPALSRVEPRRGSALQPGVGTRSGPTPGTVRSRVGQPHRGCALTVADGFRPWGSAVSPFRGTTPLSLGNAKSPGGHKARSRLPHCLFQDFQIIHPPGSLPRRTEFNLSIAGS